MTFVAWVRVIAGGTFGASVNTAISCPSIFSSLAWTGTLARPSAASALRVQLVVAAVPRIARPAMRAERAARSETRWPWKLAVMEDMVALSGVIGEFLMLI
jgi:hypothetical protein